MSTVAPRDTPLPRDDGDRPRGGPSRAQAIVASLLSMPAALAAGAALAVLLPVGEADAILTAGLMTPVVWVGCLVWSLLARDAARAALGLGGLTLASVGLVAVINMPV